MPDITPEVVAERIARFGKCYTIDDVVRLRAQDPVQTPILGIPRKKDDPADYEYFTGADLDRMIDESCRILITKGLVVVRLSDSNLCLHFSNLSKPCCLLTNIHTEQQKDSHNLCSL